MRALAQRQTDWLGVWLPGEPVSESNLGVKGNCRPCWLLSLARSRLSWRLSPTGWGSWRQQPRGRERKYKHLGSSSLHSERGESRQERSERHLVLFFYIVFSSSGTGDCSPTGSPARRLHHRDSGLSMGHPETSTSTGAMFRRIVPPAETPFSVLGHEETAGGSGEAGSMYPGQVSSLLICVL